MSAITSAVVVVDRMIAIEVRSGRYTIRISVPDRARVVGCVQHEWVRVFSKTVQAWDVWKMSPKAHVLALED